MKTLILNVFYSMVIWGCVYGACLVGSAYENEARCENGYEEVCR